MPADLFARLCAEPAFRAAVLATPARALASCSLNPQQRRLLQLAARRLQAGAEPPRCTYWWTIVLPAITQERGD